MNDLHKELIQRVKKNYDALSRFYDLLSGRAELHFTIEALKLASFEPENRILDIGCGTGSALLEIRKSFSSEALLTGIDLSYGMCRTALGKISRSTDNQGISVICGDALVIPCESALFDCILMSFTFEIIPEDLYPQLLAECRRVLNPGGRIALVCMAEEEQKNWISRLYSWSHERFPAVVDCRPLDAGSILNRNGYRVLIKKKGRLFGLPVEMIQAELY